MWVSRKEKGGQEFSGCVSFTEIKIQVYVFGLHHQLLQASGATWSFCPVSHGFKQMVSKAKRLGKTMTHVRKSELSNEAFCTKQFKKHAL